MSSRIYQFVRNRVGLASEILPMRSLSRFFCPASKPASVFQRIGTKAPGQPLCIEYGVNESVPNIASRFSVAGRDVRSAAASPMNL